MTIQRLVPDFPVIGIALFDLEPPYCHGLDSHWGLDASEYSSFLAHKVAPPSATFPRR